MKFGIKDTIDGTICDDKGFPILILNNANESVSINKLKREINLNLNIDDCSVSDVVEALSIK